MTHRLRRVVSSIVMVGALPLAACGSSNGPEAVPTSSSNASEAIVTAPGSTVPVTSSPVGAAPQPASTESPSTTPIEEVERRIPARLLIDGAENGEPWTVDLVTPDEVWNVDPDAEIDIDDDTLIRFVLAESSSTDCRHGEFVDLVYRESDRWLYPQIVSFWELLGESDDEVECQDEANPHQIVVAVLADDLPHRDFAIWVEENQPPSGLAGEVLRVSDRSVLVPTGSSGRLTGGHVGPVVFGRELDAGEEALLTGAVVFDEGCIRIGDFTVVWPYGTTWDGDEGAVVLTDGNLAVEGTPVDVAGGFHDVDELSWVVSDAAALDFLATCSPDGSVFVIQSPVRLAG